MCAANASRQEPGRLRILTAQVEQADYDAVQALAKKNERSISAEVRLALRAHLKQAA